MEDNISKGKIILKLLWIAVKAAIVVFAIFHATNVSVLYQGF